MTIPETTTSGPPRAADDRDAGRWREAARLRREFRGWVIIWLAPAGLHSAMAAAMLASSAVGLSGCSGIGGR